MLFLRNVSLFSPFRPTLAVLLWALPLLPALIGGAVPAHAQPLKRYAVIIVLDGARPDYFHLASMSNLRWLMRQGTTYRNAFAGQLPANTPPGHATVGTGVFPKHHGIQGFWWKDPVTDSVTRPTDTPDLEAGDLERVMSDHGVPSIATEVHATAPSAQVVSVAGHKCYASDAMGGPAANDILCALIYRDRWVAQAMGVHQPPPGAINNPHFDYPIPNPHSGFAPTVEQWSLGGENTWTMRYALWSVHRIHYPRVLMVNLGETDVLGHFANRPHTVMAALMRDFDRSLGQLIQAYRRAGILKRTVFVITADHGMSRVHARVPFHIFDQAIQMAGATKVYLEADTAAAIGLTHVYQARAVALNIAHLGQDAVDATYYKTRVRGVWTYRAAFVQTGVSAAVRRAYLTLTQTQAAADGADVFTVLAPHVTTGDRPINGYHWMGGHLGPQWADQHIPLIIAGSGVRHGVVSSYPARLVDIAPTVEHLLGVGTGPVDGHVLADALRHPTPGEWRVQGRVGAKLGPVVTALEARSGARPSWFHPGRIVALDTPTCSSMASCHPLRFHLILGGAGAATALMAGLAVLLYRRKA